MVERRLNTPSYACTRYTQNYQSQLESCKNKYFRLVASVQLCRISIFVMAIRSHTKITVSNGKLQKRQGRVEVLFGGKRRVGKAPESATQTRRGAPSLEPRDGVQGKDVIVPFPLARLLFLVCQMYF